MRERIKKDAPFVMLQMGWRTENMTQVRLTEAVWCGWSQLIRLKQQHINLKSIKSAETIGSTEADSQRSEVDNLSGGSRANAPCLGAAIVARQTGHLLARVTSLAHGSGFCSRSRVL